MDSLATIISAFVYLTLSVITVFLGSSNDKLIWQKGRFVLFLILTTIYCGFNVYEKIESVEKEKELQSLIISRQNDTNHKLMQLSMASLDLSTPTRYQQYPNFRLGLMWYWLRAPNDAAWHFKALLKEEPNHVPSMYNLAILLVLQHKKAEAMKLFSTIPQNELSADKRGLVQLWIKTLSSNEFKVLNPEQWTMWRYP